MTKKTILLVLLATAATSIGAQPLPTPTREARPGLRWWWLGSAVDKQNLTWNLDQYAKAGAGAVEITPIYGVQGNDKSDIPYLSPKWMDMLRYTEAENNRLDIETDMATGTGWPFGGHKEHRLPCSTEGTPLLHIQAREIVRRKGTARQAESHSPV